MSEELRHRFPRGLRVRLNADGMKLVPRTQNRSGVVVGHSRDGDAVRVRWDGTRFPESWRAMYLVHDPRG